MLKIISLFCGFFLVGLIGCAPVSDPVSQPVCTEEAFSFVDSTYVLHSKLQQGVNLEVSVVVEEDSDCNISMTKQSERYTIKDIYKHTWNADDGTISVIIRCKYPTDGTIIYTQCQ